MRTTRFEANGFGDLTKKQHPETPDVVVKFYLKSIHSLGKKTSAIMQRALPPPKVSMV